MEVRVGTSGYAYKAWKGSFYPDDLKADAFLRYYGSQFRTVEINNTFYRMPRERVLLDWARQVPEGFSFVLKASRRITHLQRLTNVEDALSYLLNTAAALGPKLGPFLFQLPPNMKKDLERLQAFLALVPEPWRAALEFRHASWFDDDVYDALRARNAALCVADTDESEGALVATADWGYLRLRRERYEEQDLAVWVERVGAQSWNDAYVFFKHEDAGAGPRLARGFLQLLER